MERAGTLVAAAEILRKRLELPGDAGMLLERAVTLDPASAEALEALEALSADAGDFDRLADVLERKLEVAARGPREQKKILARLANIYDRNLGLAPLARRAYERLLKIDPQHAGARNFWRGRRCPRRRPSRRRRASGAPRGTRKDGTCRPPPRRRHHARRHRRQLGAGRRGRADQKYWRSAGVESEPVLRANSLVAKARVSLSRGEIPAATDDLEQAITSAPQHSGALLLLAEISYRKQEWHRARELYAALEMAPDTTEAVPRADLVSRRAALAQRLGDSAEAEALYRELAILNPRHAEARRVLAELALARGDTAAAALRLEELLRLLPAGSSGDSGRSPPPPRRHLRRDRRVERRALLPGAGRRPGAGAPAGAGAPGADLPQARPSSEAAQTCGRLARLYPDPAHRAAVLYRQAEIRRTQLSDEAGALDGYLRSSDADPRFVPSRLRLIDHFWDDGDIDVVADWPGTSPPCRCRWTPTPTSMARLAIAVAGPRSPTPARFSLATHPDLSTAAVRALAQAGDQPRPGASIRLIRC